MSTEATITCHCGQQLLPKDILQRGRFPRLLSPGFVYVKFRCPRCKRLGERFIPQEPMPPLVSGFRQELSIGERARFEAMGGIDLDEVIDFHFELDSQPLRDLIR